jgi:LacI family purine nucleotide synthesis repressor
MNDYGVNMEKLNIKKISEMAGVSTTAVSFVLNNKKGVSEKTRKKILDIIERENYTPNVNSRRLILKRSFNIFLVLDNDISTLENLFYSAVINGIVGKANKLGYNVVLSLKTASFEKSPLMQAIKQNNADGVIFLQDIDNETIYELRKIKIPYVVIDSQKANPEYVCVKSNYELSSYVATKYLIDCGHKRIAFIGMSKIPDFYISTFNGYKRAISEQSLSFYPDWIQSDAYDETSAYNCMKNILNSNEVPTAVFCAGDIYAIGGMNCAYDMGYKVPYDISFSSVDNITASEYCRPKLTTIDIDKVEMGEKAIELLDAQINNNLPEKVYVIKSDKIIVRDSVRKLNA